MGSDMGGGDKRRFEQGAVRGGIYTCARQFALRREFPVSHHCGLVCALSQPIVLCFWCISRQGQPRECCRRRDEADWMHAGLERTLRRWAASGAEWRTPPPPLFASRRLMTCIVYTADSDRAA